MGRTVNILGISYRSVITMAEHKFGSSIPFAEPAWYDERNATPYYNESHRVSAFG
jgi:hypothetical protein